MVIPKEWKCNIPTEDVTITALLELPLPRRGSVECPAELLISALFSKQEPSNYVEALQESQEIPSASYLKALRAMVQKVQDDGYISVIGGFPGTPMGPIYPLWVVQYWEHLSFPVSSKTSWTHSMAWLEGNSEAHLVKEFTSVLPWISPIAAGLDFSINDLSLLLSDEWLDDNHIKFFTSFFGRIATENALPILITTLACTSPITGESQACI